MSEKKLNPLNIICIGMGVLFLLCIIISGLFDDHTDNVVYNTLINNFSLLAVFFILTGAFFQILYSWNHKHGRPGLYEYQDEERILKRLKLIQTIRVLFLSIAAYATIIIALYVSLEIFKIDGSDKLRIAEAVSIIPLTNFLPEPFENYAYLIGIAFFPLCFLVFTFLINRAPRWGKIFSKVESHFYGNFVFLVTLMIGTLCIVNFGFPDIYQGGKSLFHSYYSVTLFYRYPLIYAIIVCLLYYVVIYGRKESARFLKAKKNTLLCISLALIAITVMMNIFISFVHSSSGFLIHLDAVFYSIVQVVGGDTLLVNGFTNTYGLYPQFLLPIFKIFGLSLLHFSIIMSLLLGVCFICAFLFIRKTIRNKLIQLLAFSSIVFMGYLNGKIISDGDYYFQYAPIRLLFPYIFIYFAALYIDNRSRVLYYASFVVATFGVLWCLDTGIVVFAAWLLFLCYLEFEKNDFKLAIMNIVRISLTAVTIAAMGVIMYILSIHVYYGNYPDINLILQSAKFFSSLGFYNLPMSPLHPWYIFISIYLIGLLLAVMALIEKEVDGKKSLIFFLSILGIGLFRYYVGRSHTLTFFAMYHYIFFISAIFTDELINLVKKRISVLHNILLVCMLLFISHSAFDIGINYDKIWKLTVERKQWLAKTENSVMAQRINFIKKHTHEHEKIIIISIGASILLSESATYSAFNPGLVEMFYKVDYERLLATLSDKNYKVFLSQNFKVDYAIGIRTTIESHYDLVDQESGLLFYEKKNI